VKNFILLISIVVGTLLPYGHDYVFLIRYFLMIMLYFSFLDVSVNLNIIQKKHFIILAAIIFSSTLLFLLIKPLDIHLAEAAFITAFAPTAIAAPVIISLKKKKVEFVMFSLLLNNIVISLLLPFFLPFIVHTTKLMSVNDVLFPVLITISIPLILAQATKYFTPSFWTKLVGWKDSTFYILILNIYLATSDASTYIRTELSHNLSIVFKIGIVSLLLCIFFFSVGWLIGGKEHAAESSQSLGQKNNAFTLWISLTFMSPLSALGPVFYVLFQNIYISWQLYKHNSSN
jgi:bile acid:Na+ symporter, BASS family